MTQKYTTPMAEARGMGSVHHGSQHWLAQRVSAVLLVFLGVWFLYALSVFRELSYLETIEWIALPWNATLLTSFLLASIYHSALGWQVIVEDYIHGHWLKMYYLLFKIKLGFIMAAILGFFFIIRLVILGTHA